MKVLFIEAIKPFKKNADNIDFSLLPDSIYLAYSVQFKELAEKIKLRLGIRIRGFSQVLGCSMLKTKYPILLVGSGRFHAINLALKGNQVYILEGSKISKINEKELETIKSKRKAALVRFHSSKVVGILVSTKPGQENLKKAIQLKEALKDNGKKPYLFLSDNINFEEFENFSVDSWVNTACPALTFESKVISLHEIPY